MSTTRDTPVSSLKGCGPKRAAALKRLGIETVDDLLAHYPSGYTFAPPLVDSYWVTPKQPATVVDVVQQVDWVQSPGKPRFVAHIPGHTITWFGGEYLRRIIFKGTRLMVMGKAQYGGFVNPEFKVLRPGEVPNPTALNTVTYPCTSGITSKDIARLVRQVIDAMHDDIPLAVLRAHKAETREQADAARECLKFDELFYMQLALALRQHRHDTEPTNVRCMPVPQNISGYFPYEFTGDQNDAIDDICHDLMTSSSMNRLLQGDVGSGKTAVAAYAAIFMAMNGGQTAILCPTEVLARQHYETFNQHFKVAGLACRLVIGNNKNDPCHTSQTADVVIGTTALLSDKESFSYLGLVIIDEQHKFGVAQRAALRQHGNPHCLVMTATPIPRTIAMTVFGDLDVSTIKEMPAGRKPVETSWHKHNEGGVRDRIANELQQGHQVYVVCPRIEALDDEMRAVEEVVEEYSDLFPQYSVIALHGKMPPKRKEYIAKCWATPSPYGRILVSTTVVEVGVDNPNATVMVVEGADRFGLAQLHQLRGRVGRGKHQSYCFLLSDSDSTEAHSRLRIMERTNDGFEIAEHDLKMRGPGDLLSTRQHGLPDLKIADLVEDYPLLLEARDEARKIVAEDPELARHPELKAELHWRLGAVLDVGDVA